MDSSTTKVIDSAIRPDCFPTAPAQLTPPGTIVTHQVQRRLSRSRLGETPLLQGDRGLNVGECFNGLRTLWTDFNRLTKGLGGLAQPVLLSQVTGIVNAQPQRGQNRF